MMAMGEQSKDNLLHISWCDSRWVPVLNASNILDYFTERSNPFYSKDCNNEFLKMQQSTTRVDQLQQMQGTEYMLLHAQDPILYIVRKQHRYSSTQVNPQSCYHIIAGQVFQTPDLGSVINSRLVSSVNHINSAFCELQSFSQYHPSKGYWWQTPKQNSETTEQQKKNATKKTTRKDEVASIFQRRRVDLLLTDLAHKFPYKHPAQQSQQAASLTQNAQQAANTQSAESVKTEETKSDVVKNEIKAEMKSELKVENSVQPPPPPQRIAKPPPEKRQKLGP